MDVEKIVREYIEKSLHMSLATTSNNKPWVCEVHFVYDDNLNLYWRSLKTRRHSQEIAKNPQVAGNIVRQHSLSEGPQAIYFEGRAELIDDEKTQQTLLPLFQKRLGKDGSILDEAKKVEGTKFYKATIKNWYAFGKFDGPKFDKYKLDWNGGEGRRSHDIKR